MKSLVAALFILVMTRSGLAQVPISHYTLPQPYNQQAPSDPDLKDLVWNKWQSGTFTILSLDPNQGKYLDDNIEQMKRWTFTRWGFPDIQFSAECRVLCVPNKELMNKLFRLDGSHGEVRRNSAGQIEMSVLWLVLDQPPAEVVPSALTVVCMAELEQAQRKNIGFWLERGMTVLNGTIPQIKERLASLNGPLSRDDKFYVSSKILSLTEEQWKKETVERRNLIDSESAALCLLLRKEFGQSNLLKFIGSNQTEQDFSTVYGFKGYTDFDATFARYMLNLSNDLVQNRTPVSYLQVSPPRN